MKAGNGGLWSSPSDLIEGVMVPVLKEQMPLGTGYLQLINSSAAFKELHFHDKKRIVKS